jgi:hypothetical protein
MKLRLLFVLFALVAPLAACDNSPKSTTSPTSVQSSVPPSSPPAIAPSPTFSSSPSSIFKSPAPLSPSPLSPSPNIALSPSPSATPGSKFVYNSPEGNYTAQFPAKPEEQKKSAQSPQGNISGVEVRYIDQTQERIYLARHLTLPFPPNTKLDQAKIEGILDNAQASAVQTSGAALKDAKKITQNGLSGRQFTMTLPNGMAAKARIFINPNKLLAYQVLVAAKNGKVDFPEAQAFLDSLTIKQ